MYPVLFILCRYNEFKSQITVLLHTLSSDESEGRAKPTTTGPYMLMKFRKVALVIIAAYRMRRSINSSRRVFQFTDSHSSQSVVCLGSLRYAKRRCELILVIIKNNTLSIYRAPYILDNRLLYIKSKLFVTC